MSRRPDFYRDYSKLILPVKLHQELSEAFDIFHGIISDADGTDSFRVYFTENPTSSQDIAIKQVIDDHVPSDSFLEQIALTDARNVEGFAVYKRIFAHISDNDAVTNIDGFIMASDSIHKLRNFMKDGNFETAIRYFHRTIKPMNLFNHQDLYYQWIVDLALKYNPLLGVVNPDFEGTPFEGKTTLYYIEESPSA